MEKFSLLSDNSQFSSASAVYNVGSICRTVAPVLAEVDHHQFLVGTTCLRKRNQIHLIEYNDSDNVVECKCVLDHPGGEVWGLFPSPAHRELVFVVYNNTSTYERECALLSLGTNDDDGGGTRADASAPVACPPVFTLPTLEALGPMICVVWRPIIDADDSFSLAGDLDGELDGEAGAAFGNQSAAGSPELFMTVHTNGFQIWELAMDEATQAPQLQPRSESRGVVWNEQNTQTRGALGIVSAAAWDPHHKDQVLLAVGLDLVTFRVDDSLTEVGFMA